MFAFSKEAKIGLTFAAMIRGTLKNGIKFEARSQSQISRVGLISISTRRITFYRFGSSKPVFFSKLGYDLGAFSVPVDDTACTIGSTLRRHF